VTTAFQRGAWQSNAFQIDDLPPAGGGGSSPSQGYGGHEQRRRTRRELAEDRARFGIPQEAQDAISIVAKQQADRLETDAQKQLDELRGELKLRGLELESVYLQALAAEREALISAEIARRLLEKLKKQDEEELMMFLLVAAAAAT
jgi:transcriptional regulator NrdR family protein